MKTYYATISQDISVKADNENQAIAVIKKEHQFLGVNIDIEIYDEEE
tara:strand:+ start:547 stop:687 length:141 start_codon:yes stop_codon:yes gene_type:complete